MTKPLAIILNKIEVADSFFNQLGGLGYDTETYNDLGDL